MYGQLTSSTGTHYRFFSPNEVTPILNGLFEYNSAFAAFLKATEQKKQTAHIVGLLVQRLQQRKMLLPEGVIKVADLGCADSSSCLGYLGKMSNSSGFDYSGFDINDAFLADAESVLSRNS